jgi:carboxypeptidase family protein
MTATQLDGNPPARRAAAHWWSAGIVAIGRLVTAVLSRRHDAAAVIHGWVLDGAGKPVPHAAISVLDPTSRQIAHTSTHADGSYAVHVAEGGSLAVIGSAPGHQPKVAGLTVDGAPVRYDIVLLAGPGGLVGTARDADGNAVADVRVVVTDWWGEVIASTTTDANGEYRIDDLVPDRYTVTTTSHGHDPVATAATVNGKSHNRFDLTVAG